MSINNVSWQLAIDNIAAPNAAPSASTDGIAVPALNRGEYVHVAVKKANTATVSVHGMIGRRSDGTAVNEWFVLQTYTMSTSTSVAEPLVAAAAYDRLAVEVSAIGGGNVSVWVGLQDSGY